MLDTVTVRICCPLRVRLLKRKVDAAPGVRIWADAALETLQKVECSLPKVLFGHNGRVLENQDQIDAALKKCADILSAIALVPDISLWKPWRVDLVWNFDLPTLALVMAHSALRVPGIHRGATLHNGGEGVSWRGEKSRKMITLYDKARQMRVPGSALRAEVSLRAVQLGRYFSGKEWRSFEHLYRVYRSIMASIPPVNSTVKADSLLEAIALESAEIRNRILARLSHKPARTFRRYRQQVEAAAAQLEAPFSWADVLPEGTPPAAVHVTPSKMGQSVQGHSSARARTGNQYRLK